MSVDRHVPVTGSSELHVACDESAIHGARAWLRDVLGPASDPDRRDRAELVLSELLTNAIVHARTPALVQVARSAEGLRLGVRDSGPGWPALMPADPARIGGVGLQVVDQLAEAWGIEPGEPGKLVWARLAAP